jgi:transketolase
MNKLEKRLIDLSFKYKLSHIGSGLNTINFLKHTYDTKEKDAIVLLANAHAGLALYVVLEDLGVCDAEEMIRKHGFHATKDTKHGVEATGGSLGWVEAIGVGMALADRAKNVYLITSDGACAEGSVWEALRIAGEQKLDNLRVAVIANKYGAYGEIDLNDLDIRLNLFFPVYMVRVNLYQYPDWLQDLGGHYAVMDEKMYEEICA